MSDTGTPKLGGSARFFHPSLEINAKWQMNRSGWKSYWAGRSWPAQAFITHPPHWQRGCCLGAHSQPKPTTLFPFPAVQKQFWAGGGLEEGAGGVLLTPPLYPGPGSDFIRGNSGKLPASERQDPSTIAWSPRLGKQEKKSSWLLGGGGGGKKWVQEDREGRWGGFL